jgi:hypothetical protein
VQSPYSIVRGLGCYYFVIGIEREIYECHKINVNDKKSSCIYMMGHYTGGSAVGAGRRTEGMLCERMDARAILAATGGAGVVGDE